jgi:DNA-binding MarR family transcriptional regulator
MRRERDKVLPPEFVGEPAWDMLLALYSEHPSKLPLSSLCYGSGAPPTTAMRWIRALEDDGILEQTAHSRDAGLMLVSLTRKGRLMVERALRAMLKDRFR